MAKSLNTVRFIYGRHGKCFPSSPLPASLKYRDGKPTQHFGVSDGYCTERPAPMGECSMVDTLASHPTQPLPSRPANAPFTSPQLLYVFFVAVIATIMVALAKRDVGPEHPRAPLGQTSVGWVSPPMVFPSAWPLGSTLPGARPPHLSSASPASFSARRSTRLDVLCPPGPSIHALGPSQKKEVRPWAAGTCL